MVRHLVLATSFLLLFCLGVKGQSNFCTFDNGTCGYLNDISGSDDLDWSRLRYQAKPSSGQPSWLYKYNRFRSRGPRRDHTTGRGYYMYTKTRGFRGRQGDLARLISRQFKNVSCLKFYYYMFGLDIGGLEVIVNRGNSAPTKVWSLYGNQGHSWKLAMVPIESTGNVQFFFQGVVGALRKSSVAIDDVNVTSDNCYLFPKMAKPDSIAKVQGSCDFDANVCGYRNLGNHTWTRFNGTTPSSGTGPKRDHTTGLGMYMYVEASGIKEGTSASLSSPLLFNKSCVTFYYHMFGSQIGTFNVYKLAQGRRTTLFQVNGNQGNRWYQAKLVLDQDGYNSNFSIMFEGIKGRGYKGDIAIDDVTTSNNPCSSAQITPRPSVLPTTRDNSNLKVSVRLVNGATKYEGRVEVLYKGRWGTICDDLWDLSDAKVVCKMLGFPGAISAERSGSFEAGSGSIWLDDVKCTGFESSIARCRHAGWGNNNCGHSEDAGVICKADITIPMKGECNFEYGKCGYTNADRSVSEFDWRRNKGPTSSTGTGPARDMSGKGYYMYIEVSSGGIGARAKLISPVLPASSKCVQFYYHMMGRDIGALNVYIKEYHSSSMTDFKIWTLSRQQANMWLLGKAPLNVTGNRKIKIVFEGVRGKDYKGDIAIDSISILNSTCVISPEKAKPSSQVESGLEGDIRLAGHPNPLEGRVEIFHNGQWGTICSDFWGDEDATVVCRMLGFPGVGRARNSSRKYGVGSGIIWLDDVRCTGSESSILQCRKKMWGVNNCQHSQDAAVVCSNGTSDDECRRYKVLNSADRAMSYTSNSNNCDRMSVIFPGQWHRFQGSAGTRMPSTCVPINRCGTHATGWLSGSHPTVDQGMVRRKVCFHWSSSCCKWSTFIRVKNCSDFYVYELQKPPVCQLRYCGNGRTQGGASIPLFTTPAPTGLSSIRLVGSSKKYAGRVEVLYNGLWGTVCDDEWDLQDAMVVCRMMGFSGALRAHSGGTFGRGIGKIWLDNVRCTGNEESLVSCPHRGWSVNNCGHSEDAGVTCASIEMSSCDFEKDFCGYQNTNLNDRLSWVRRKAVKPKEDHTIGSRRKLTCLNGWLSYAGNCYLFTNKVGRITWQNAKYRCVSQNAWLVDIRDKNEWQFVKSQRQFNVQQYYIGIQEFNQSRVWRYLDGSIMNLTNIWAKGEPNDWNGNKEDCGAMDFRSSEGKYNDVPCGRAYGFAGMPDSFICKKKPTRNLGHFLYVDFSDVRKKGFRGRLVGPPVSNLTCLTFYYNTFGTSLDSLSIQFRLSLEKEVIAWQLDGDHTNQWNKAQIPLDTMGSTKYKIIFQVTSGGSGQIAIDDVNVTRSSSSRNSCDLIPKKAVPPMWRTKGSCNFDNDTCGYRNDESGMDDLQWIRYKASIYPSGNKPFRDHTSYSGSLLYMQYPLGQKSGHSARLISPILSPSLVKCMIFYWYFNRQLAGSNIELTVYVHPVAQHVSASGEVAVWRKTNEGSQVFGYWKKGVVSLVQNSNFQVIFEGLYVRTRAIIALDDIIMLTKKCTTYPSDAAPSIGIPSKSGIRLRGSSSEGVGRVEIYHLGRWGTVCADEWTMNNAQVVCRQLGFEGAISALCCGLFGKGSGRVWLNGLRCRGNEASLTLCPNPGWGNNQCGHDKDAAVVCKTSKSVKKEVEVRLNGTATNYQGRVEVKYVGVWGTIDDNGWDILDATVVCRQLGFTGAIGAFIGSTFGRGNGPIWLSNVHCNGNETKLSECGLHFVNSNSIYHTQAGVECFSARLADGGKPNEGRVELLYKGKWTTVCGTNWNMNEANVICRDLGYQGAKSTSIVGKGSGQVLLEGVKCKGDEASIMLCSHSGFNYHNCDHSQDVGVVCSNDKKINECSINPCKNNGKCSTTKQGFTCQCSGPFTGRKCETSIAAGIVGIMLKGHIDKWDPQIFKSDLAKMINKYCSECSKTSVRAKRETSNLAVQFTPDDIIIVQSSRFPPRLMYIELAVVKTINSKHVIVNPDKLQQAITEGASDGIGGFSVIAIQEKKHKRSAPSRQHQARSSNGSSIALKIGIAVILTLLLSVVGTLSVIYLMRRKRKSSTGNTYQLNSMYANSSRDNQVLINEEDNQSL